MTEEFTGYVRAFLGSVVDVKDPEKRGRVRIRVPNDDDGVDDENLAWAFPLNPVQSATQYLEKAGGVGLSPLGLLPGSFVYGFFLDSSKELRLVLGTIPRIVKDQTSNKAQHDVPALAREINDITRSPVEFGGSDNLPGVKFKEPDSTYKAKYPLNKVMRTSAGHTVEYDDTPGAERIHIYHGSGSYIEMTSDGSVVSKTLGNDTHVTVKDNTIFIEGKSTIIVKGEANILSDTKIKLQAPVVEING